MNDIKVLVGDTPVGRLTEFNATSPRVSVPIYEIGATQGPYVLGVSEFHLGATLMPGEKPPPPPPRNRAERRKRRKG